MRCDGTRAETTFRLSAKRTSPFKSAGPSVQSTVLQGMIDKLIETGRYYDMEMNVEKTKVMIISRQPSPVTIKIDQKQLENVKCLNIWVAC